MPEVIDQPRRSTWLIVGGFASVLLLIVALFFTVCISPILRVRSAVSFLRARGFSGELEAPGRPTWLAEIVQSVCGKDLMATPLALTFTRQQDADHPDLTILPESLVVCDKNLLADRDMWVLQECRGLLELRIERQLVTDQGLKCLAGSTLKSLWLTNCPMGSGQCVDDMREGDVLASRPFAVLRTIPQLTEVVFRHLNVSDADLDDIAAISTLEHLELNGTCVTSTGVAKLARLPNLVSLTVEEAILKDGQLLEILKTFPSLQSIYYIDRATDRSQWLISPGELEGEFHYSVRIRPVYVD